jgi:hypothetical protein
MRHCAACVLLYTYTAATTAEKLYYVDPQELGMNKTDGMLVRCELDGTACTALINGTAAVYVNETRVIINNVEVNDVLPRKKVLVNDVLVDGPDPRIDPFLFDPQGIGLNLVTGRAYISDIGAPHPETGALQGAIVHADMYDYRCVSHLNHDYFHTATAAATLLLFV